jgi:hypothetical protein
LSWYRSIDNKVVNFLRSTFQDPFKRYLIISLTILGIVVGVTSQGTAKPTEGFEVHFFYLPGCEHCEAQEPFNEKLEATYSINITRHDATQPAEHALLSQMLKERGEEYEPGYPITIFGNQVFGGWESEEISGKAIETALKQCLAGDCPPPTNGESGSERPKINLPLIGEIDPAEYSLPALAVILGLVDGFNPCAMWVLVYLISIVATLRDKKRIWLLCGSFVLASGILYFLFMTAWLNAYLLIGYVKPVTVVVSLVALGGGILLMREFAQTKGAIVCEVTDEESRKKTMSKIQNIVASPVTLGTIIGIVVLAFTVNSIEFVCSAAIPAVFTQVLALRSLSTFEYYGYILLYDLFFMLDDIVVFSSAAFAMTSSLGDRYAKYTRPVGGTILIILGILLLACLYSSQFAFLRPMCGVLW